MLVAKGLPMGKTLTLVGVLVVALGTIIYLVYTNFISTGVSVNPGVVASTPAKAEVSAAEAKYKLPSGQIINTNFFNLPAVEKLLNFGSLPVTATPVPRDNPFAPLSPVRTRGQ